MKIQKCCDQRWNSSLCWIGQLRCLNWVNLARDDYDEPHFDLKKKCNDNLSHQLPIILVAAKKSYQLLYLYLDEIQSIFFCIVSKSLRIYMVFDKSLPGGKSKPLYLCFVKGVFMSNCSLLLLYAVEQLLRSLFSFFRPRLALRISQNL